MKKKKQERAHLFLILQNFKLNKMIKYRTVVVEPDFKAKSSLSSKRYLVDMVDLRIRIQETLEEYDEMGYDLIEMEPFVGSYFNNTMTQGFILIFKMRE